MENLGSDEPLGLQEMPESVVDLVLSKLPPRDFARVSTLCKFFHSVASRMESKWREALVAEIGDLPLLACDPTPREVLSGRLGVMDPIKRRARRAWARIECFLALNKPAMLATLQGPATREELSMIEQRLGLDLRPELVAIYEVIGSARRSCDSG